MFTKLKSMTHIFSGKIFSNYLKLNEYDLPLHKSEDSRFLILIITLMNFLAILTLSGTFALSDMTSRWSSGLENKITIEIPVETKDGVLLSEDTLKKETKKIFKKMEQHPNVSSIKVLEDKDIAELISPWLGDDLALVDIPLPVLIAVELKVTNEETLNAISDDLRQISTYGVIQSHQDWLHDLINFVRNLKFLALVITFIIILTTLTAVIAGIKARMAIHKRELELLHLMGATDDYIARQFQHHTLKLSLKGSLIGTFIGISITLLMITLSAHSGTSLLPRIEISLGAFLMLCLIPFLTCIIASLTARITVLRSLAYMP